MNKLFKNRNRQFNINFCPETIYLGGSFSHIKGNSNIDKLIEKLNEMDTSFIISKKPE